MTHEEKIQYMQIACGMAGYVVDEKAMDMFVSLYELVIEKKGETDLDSVCKIKASVIERDNVKKRIEALDKVSEKVNQ